MKGLHLTADLYRCRCAADWLADARQLHAWCAAAAEAVGLRPMAHAFQVSGPSETGDAALTGALLMEGAHLCLHTWPGERAVSADVYVSGADAAAKARGLMSALVQRFQPEWTEQRSLDRGDEG